MKNVKVILISCALFATIFANARIDALGGDAGFWPGDRANLDAFPQTINDLGFVEMDNVDLKNADGSAADYINTQIVFGDATKWGFSYDGNSGDDMNPWFNISWGNGDMGLSVAMVSQDDADDTTEDASGFGVAWGQNMSFGELGVNLNSYSNEGKDYTSYGVNWRGDCSAWIFDNAKATLSMESNDDVDEMHLGWDMFTHMDVGSGATVLFGMGFDYDSNDDATWMTLPAATVAVEAGLTDWATLRAFASHSYLLSCSNDGTTGCTDGESGDITTDYGFGLGFDWGAVSLDMEVGNTLFVDPVSTITGYNGTNLNSGQATLSYSF